MVIPDLDGGTITTNSTSNGWQGDARIKIVVCG